MEKFSIRKTYSEPLMKSLHSDTFPLDEFHHSTKNHYWAIKKDGDHVGFCILTILDTDIAFLSRAGLMESARGRGLHRKMILVRERYARSKGVKSIIT
ncbi:MAG: GNAT family N-acetyltransferase, partial [Candidatus Njordarchaeales archaeon]